MRPSYFSVILTATTALATPLLLGRQSPNGTTRPSYRLRVSAPDSPALDGKYLSINGDKVGIYDGGKEAGAVSLGTAAGTGAGFCELHTLPIGIVDHALGLVGSNGLLDFVDVVSPNARTFPAGTTFEWRSFTLGEVDPATKVPLAGSNKVSYGVLNAEDHWTAWPSEKQGDYEIRWWDGSGVVIQVYEVIDIVYEKVVA